MKQNYEQELYLGLDTSAYTTSLALVDCTGKLVFDSRLPLAVSEGSLGLRQSEAVFTHLKNMPLLWESSALKAGRFRLAAVSASTRPRPLPSSYMPVFKVGEAFGLVIAQTMGLSFLPSTHQEGHVMAGLWSAGLDRGRYMCAHLSGGTSEIVSAEEKEPGRLDLKLLSESGDLNAGQFIDRLGRLMGLGFPAGPQLEKLAQTGEEGAVQLPVAVTGSRISFSGPATRAERILNSGGKKEDVARAIEVCIADSLIRALGGLLEGTGSYDGILAVGGVTANRYIKERLKQKLEAGGIYFADPIFASDNAAGLAVQAARYYKV